RAAPRRAAHQGAAVSARVAELQVTISSFGYKYGPQVEADWVVDARMMRNPFWVDELRPFTGLDRRVHEYVLGDENARELLRRMAELLTWACPRYLAHGRDRLHVAIGCTGGRHRSVVLACELASTLRIPNTLVSVHHRDVDKPDPR
ncbi:MAG: RNase adaptor protein RapZ, partial [Candidatus Dormibacteria bacterium]